MHTSTCPASCRWLVVLRSGRAMCSRWKKPKEPMKELRDHREPDEWGEPRWIKREGCDSVENRK